MIEDVGVLMEAEKVVLRSLHFWGSVRWRYRLLTYILAGDIEQDNSECTLNGLDQLPPSGGHLWLVELPDCNSYLAFWSRFDYLEQTFDFCEKELIGQSHEGQDMIVMKVKAHYLGMFPDIDKTLQNVDPGLQGWLRKQACYVDWQVNNPRNFSQESFDMKSILQRDPCTWVDQSCHGDLDAQWGGWEYIITRSSKTE